MEEEKIYSVTEPVGSEQDAPVSNMEMLSDVFFKEDVLWPEIIDSQGL